MFADELGEEGVQLLDEPRFWTLLDGLRLHSDGRVSGDPTIGTCWDADRLHLPRVSIRPDPALFSTRATHHPAALSAAEALRERGPPVWHELVELVVARS